MDNPDVVPTHDDSVIERQARELVERTTKEQGLPFHVEDPATLAQVAWLIRSDDE
jgi:hypothetical protein